MGTNDGPLIKSQRRSVFSQRLLSIMRGGAYVQHVLPRFVVNYGCATRQFLPTPRSTFKGTDRPSCFPTALISCFINGGLIS